MTWIDDKRAEVGEKRMFDTLHRIGMNHPTYVRENAHGDRGFALWLMMVDRRLKPLSHRDLADWHWRDAFDDGVDPAEAAKDATTADYFDGFPA